jgi:hypothetical protein
MPRTSDFCPRCKSVQKGLRLLSGEFVCLTCSSKEVITAAIAGTSFQSRGQPSGPEFRASPRAGLAASVLGGLCALAAIPACLYCHSAGSNGKALILIMPFATVAFFIGLLNKRHVLGTAGAILSVVALAEALGLTLYLESEDAGRRGQGAAGKPAPAPQALVRPAPSPKSAVAQPLPVQTAPVKTAPDTTVTGQAASLSAATDQAGTDKAAALPPVTPPVAVVQPAPTSAADDQKIREMAMELRRLESQDLARERQRQRALRALDDLKKRYNAELARNVSLLDEKTKVRGSRATLADLVGIYDRQAAALRQKLQELSQRAPRTDPGGLQAQYQADAASLANKLAPLQIELEGQTFRLQTIENDLVVSQQLLDRMKNQIEALTLETQPAP